MADPCSVCSESLNKIHVVYLTCYWHTALLVTGFLVPRSLLQMDKFYYTKENKFKE